MGQNKITIDISIGTIWKIVGVAVLIVFLYFIKDVLVIILMAIVVTSAALPIVNKLEHKKIPRFVTTVLLFVAFFSLVGAMFYLIIPRLVSESKSISEALAGKIEIFRHYTSNINLGSQNDVNGQQIMDKFSEGFSRMISGVFSNTISTVGKIFQTMLIFSLSFYMLIRKNGAKQMIELMTPVHYQKYAHGLVKRIQRKMSCWLLGEVTLMVTIFLLDLLLLTALGVPYATILAFLGGMLELIPYIGPVTATIPAIIIGFSISPWIGVLVLVGYILIQQLENNVIVPLIMKRATGLNPVIIIISLLVGAKIAGILGMILAVPVATVISVFVSDILNSRIIREKIPDEKSALES